MPGIYREKLTSVRTTLLFIFLTMIFGLLYTRRMSVAGQDGWSIVLFCLTIFFLFYTFNYLALYIELDKHQLTLRFGIFRWQIAIENIENCFRDRTSLWRIGGAGIHFSPIGGRYRAMFNFLEYPRVVIMLKQKKGAVRDIAFSTRNPEQVMTWIRNNAGIS